MSVSTILYKSFSWKLVHFLISFFTTVALAHILKPAGSAGFYSLLYFFLLIISFFSFGLDISLNYFISRKELTSRAGSTIVLLLTIVTLLISIPCIYWFYTPGAATGFSINEIVFFAGLQIAGGLFSTLGGSIFTAHHQSHIATRMLVAFSAVFLSASIVLYYTDIENTAVIFYVWYITTFLQGLCIFLYSFYKYRDRPAVGDGGIASLKKVFRFSLAAFMINFIFYAAGKLAAFLLPYWVTASEAGNYIQAYKLIEYAGAVVAFMYYPIVAIAAKEEQRKAQDIILLFVRIFNTITVMGSLLLLFFGRTIFTFIYGHAFDAMYGVFMCLAPALIISCSSAFFTAYFFGKRYLKYNLLSAGVLLLTLVMLIYPFTRLYGINGAALALSIASVLSIAVDILCFRRLHYLKLKEALFINKKDIGLIVLFFKNRGAEKSA